VFGKKDADNQIADFYEDIGETPPRLIELEAILKKKSKRLTHGWEAQKRRGSRRYASSDESESDSDSNSDSDASGMFVPRRRRKRSAR